MSKKKSQSKFFITHILLAISVIVLAFGLWQILDSDNYYSKLRDNCDLKDYSSYVEYVKVESETSKSIKEQLELYKNAMDRAMDANDYNAYGQLNDKYQELLKLQSQDKSSDGYYDYSKAEKAKNACYNSATVDKDSKTKLGIIISVVSGTFILCLGIIEVVHYLNTKITQGF